MNKSTEPQDSFIKIESGGLGKFTNEYRGSIYYNCGRIDISRLKVNDLNNKFFFDKNLSDKIVARATIKDQEVPFSFKSFKVLSNRNGEALASMTAVWSLENDDFPERSQDIERSWEMKLEIDDNLLEDFPCLKIEAKNAELTQIGDYYSGEIIFKSLMSDKTVEEYEMRISDWMIDFDEISRNGYNPDDDHEYCITTYIGYRHNVVNIDKIEVLKISGNEVTTKLSIAIDFELQMVRWWNYKTSFDVVFTIEEE